MQVVLNINKSILYLLELKEYFGKFANRLQKTAQQYDFVEILNIVYSRCYLNQNLRVLWAVVMKNSMNAQLLTFLVSKPEGCPIYLHF